VVEFRDACRGPAGGVAGGDFVAKCFEQFLDLGAQPSSVDIELPGGEPGYRLVSVSEQRAIVYPSIDCLAADSHELGYLRSSPFLAVRSDREKSIVVHSPVILSLRAGRGYARGQLTEFL
jgi:hypothetical protein